MAVESMNRIENQVTIRAPRSKVWKALTTPSEFAQWFRATLDVNEFRPGERANAVSTYPGHEGVTFFLEVVEKVPESRFTWRWSPGAKAIEPAPQEDPYTTVVFELEEVQGGTLVKVTESGFDKLSLARRAKAFAYNTQGWAIQIKNIRDYVEQNR